ncbi:MAG: hypothetical protein ACK4Z4_01125 [Ferrovibrio sp.]
MSEAHAVARYTTADLGLDSPAWKELEGAVQREAQSTHLPLTDQVGAAPPNLTPEMLAWFNVHVFANRKAALDEAAAGFDALSNGNKAAGVFLERELDRIEDQRLTQKREALVTHKQKNAARFSELAQAREEENTARIRYQGLEQRHNRAPKLPPWWYYPALILMLPAEGGINYETFMAVKWMTPAFALGTVVVLGFVLALSAHLYGTLLRQARILFDRTQDDVDRLVGWRMLSIGTLSLSVVLAVVWYARAAYFADTIRIAGVLGGDAPSAMMTIGGSLLGNLAIWLGGVMLAFMLHDPDPHFPKSLLDWKEKSAAAKRLQEALEKPLQAAFDKIDAIAKRDREQAQNRHNAITHMQDYQKVRVLFNRICEQDAKTLGLLTRYRSQLVNASRGKAINFEKSRDVGVEDAERLTAEQYAAVTLRLKYL